MGSGVAALNIIPDRNYTPGVKDELAANLYSVVSLAQELDLPVIVGTEMNSPGQKFVDDFDSEELSALLPVFLTGMHIVYAHSILQRRAGISYVGDWARVNFSTRADKNDFFEKVGQAIEPVNEDILNCFNETSRPREIARACGFEI